MRFRLTVMREADGVSLMHVEAQSEAAAIDQAGASGADVISIQAETAWLAGTSWRRKPFPLLLISQEILALLRAGVGLIEAFETLIAGARRHEDAAGLMNPVDVAEGMLLSLLVEQERRLRRIERRIEASETQQGEASKD